MTPIILTPEYPLTPTPTPKGRTTNGQSQITYKKLILLNFQVFIHGGKVHIIPLPSTPREITLFPTGTPTLTSALEIINGSSNTLADDKIQQAISQRIQGWAIKNLWMNKSLYSSIYLITHLWNFTDIQRRPVSHITMPTVWYHQILSTYWTVNHHLSVLLSRHSTTGIP